jgi:hypothetical protein
MDPELDQPFIAHVIVYTTPGSLRDWTILETTSSQPHDSSFQALMELMMLMQNKLRTLTTRKSQDAHSAEKAIGSAYARLG